MSKTPFVVMIFLFCFFSFSIIGINLFNVVTFLFIILYYPFCGIKQVFCYKISFYLILGLVSIARQYKNLPAACISAKFDVGLLVSNHIRFFQFNSKISFCFLQKLCLWLAAFAIVFRCMRAIIDFFNFNLVLIKFLNHP